MRAALGGKGSLHSTHLEGSPEDALSEQGDALPGGSDERIPLNQFSST